MSIASEITRIQNAKASIKTAIENKGVQVPSNALLDTFATYIAQITGGSSNITIETGTYTPSEDIARPTISFNNSHNKVPVFLSFTDVTQEATAENSGIGMNYIDTYQLFGDGYIYNSNTLAKRYATLQYIYKGTSATSVNTGTTHFSYNSDDTHSSGSSYPRYYVDNTSFRPYTSSGTRYWRAGRTYKWFAIWLESQNS